MRKVRLQNHISFLDTQKQDKKELRQKRIERTKRKRKMKTQQQSKAAHKAWVNKKRDEKISKSTAKRRPRKGGCGGCRRGRG